MAEGGMKPAVAILERRTLGFLARQLARPINRTAKHSKQELAFRQFATERLGVSRRRRVSGEAEQIEPANNERSRGTFHIDEREEARKRATLPKENDELRFFTDGSCQEVRGFLGRPEMGAGAGVVWEAPAKSVKRPWAEVDGCHDLWWEGRAYHVGIQKEAFDGELFAIWMALKRAVKMQTQDTKLVRIYTDSRVAMEKVLRDDNGAGQSVARAIRGWEKRVGANARLEYRWVPTRP